VEGADDALGGGVSLLGWDWPPTVCEHPATTSTIAESTTAQRRMAATVSGESV
jgi:hypothetical protein